MSKSGNRAIVTGLVVIAFTSIVSCQTTDPLSYPPSSLHDAASRGDVARVMELLNSGADPNERIRRWGIPHTPLEAAVEGKTNIETVRKLLAKGAAPAKGLILWHAAHAKTPSPDSGKIFELLHKAGARLPDHDALYHAATHRNRGVVEYLVKQGWTLREGNTPYILQAVHDGEPIEILPLLVQLGADVNKSNEWDVTPLAGCGKTLVFPCLLV